MDNVDFSFPHVEDLHEFKEALAYSEVRTGFSALLIEKDYYCSLILRSLYHSDIDISNQLVFKGGTCLSKVYVDFYRLSEDLDFVIPVDSCVGRTARRKKMDHIKKLYEQIPKKNPGITIKEPLQGHNESKQYIGYIQYLSALYEREEDLKIEIGLRENLVKKTEEKYAKSIIRNPFTRKEYVKPFSLTVISLSEAYAEKRRAALSRKIPAIRDYYDIFYAHHKLGFDLESTFRIVLDTARLLQSER